MKKGMDISVYQRRWDKGIREYVSVDFERASKIENVSFVHIRLTSCEYDLVRRRMKLIVDPMANPYIASAHQYGVITRGYSLLDYTGCYTPEDQAKIAYNLNPTLSRYFADFEQKYFWWKSLPSRKTCLWLLDRWCTEMAGLASEARLGWYGNLSLWRYLQPHPEWLKKIPFWFAGPGFKTIPADVQCRWWQYSWKGDGKAHGCGSKSVDLNWELES